MTYQAFFPRLPLPQPKTLLQGIMAKVALGQFVLGRTPSTKPASQQATCPYRPYHVIDAGQNYAAAPVAGPQLGSRPAVLTPVYTTNPGNQDTTAQDFATTAATPMWQYPANAPTGTVSYALLPPALTAAYPASVPEEDTTTPYLPGRATDSAFTYPAEPAPGNQTEPAKPPTPGEQLPTKTVECR